VLTVAQRGTLGSLLALLLVGGCAASPHRESPPVGYPFGGAGHVTAAEQAVLASAEDLAVTDCMAREGLSYISRPIRPTPDPGNPYGLLSVDDARASGYGLNALAERETASDPNAAPVARLAPPDQNRWHQALLGTDQNLQKIVLSDGSIFSYRSDACTYQAHLSVVGAAWDALYMQVSAETAALVDDVQADARVTAAQNAWSTCMRQHGYQVAGLPDAREAASTQPLSQEREIATADAGCQQQAQMWPAVNAAATTLETQNQALAARTQRLRDLRATAAATAEALLNR
jgi:hypothetical protein